jgi:hypothetical protein
MRVAPETRESLLLRLRDPHDYQAWNERSPSLRFIRNRTRRKRSFLARSRTTSRRVTVCNCWLVQQWE